MEDLKLAIAAVRKVVTLALEFLAIMGLLFMLEAVMDLDPWNAQIFGHEIDPQSVSVRRF